MAAAWCVADPTRIIQGIVTGIGFLGAGVIMREGFNISGLTTAASIWTSSVIGILVGVGFYLAAMGLAFVVGHDHDLPVQASRRCCRRATRWPS